MTMTASQKVTRSQTLRIVTQTAGSLGIDVVDQFELGGRALVGRRGFEALVWLESDGKWHSITD